MAQDLGEIKLAAGQTIVVSGPKALRSNTNSTKTRVRVTAPGVYVPPVDPTPIPPEPTPIPPPTGHPTPPAGYKEAFWDAGTTWDASRYDIYNPADKDTSGNGYRNGVPGDITSDGTAIKGHMYVGSDGKGRGVHFVPKVTGAHPGSSADLADSIVEYDFRADDLPGFKCAHLHWPISFGCWTTSPQNIPGPTCHQWPQWGEFDMVEGGLARGSSLTTFLHIQNGSSDGHDQLSASLGVVAFDWHRYRAQFVAGKIAKVWVDGVLSFSCTDTTKVPAGEMHWVFQNETLGGSMGGSPPVAGTSGYVYLKNLVVWTPA